LNNFDFNSPLSVILENLPNTYLSIINPDYTVGYTNGGKFKELGLNPQEFIGLHAKDIFGEHFQFVASYYQKAFAGEVCEFDLFINNEYQHYKVVPLEDGTKAITKILSVATDVTKAHRTRAQLLENQEKLLEAQKIAKLGRWELDLISGELTWSDEIYHIFGTKKGEFSKTYESFLDFIHPEDRSMVNEVYQQSLLNKSQYDIGHRILLKDGTIKYVRESGITHYDQDGTALRTIGTVHDITEQKNMEEKLSRSEKLQSVGQLAGGIAHDFNNQLTGILGFSEMIKTISSNAEIQEYANNIVQSAEQAAKLISQLLLFSKQGKYTIERINIHAVINDAIKILNHSVKKDIIITRDFAACDLYVDGDYGQLQNAILNIFLNAVDAMPDGGDISIETSQIENSGELSESVQELVQIKITDTGNGIPIGIISKIFDPFFTTKNVDKGTGMGLAAVHGTIDKHHGTIEVQSKDGVGTTFLILLPHQAKQDTNSVFVDNAFELSTKNILAVDDERMNRIVLKKQLSTLHHSIEVFSNGTLLLDYIAKSEEQPDLIIMDYIMPGMSGKELHASLKKLSLDVPIIICSGYSKENEICEILKDSNTYFLQKPFLKSDLAKVLHEASTAAKGRPNG
jgi:PAS domain S-box-containing protein